MTLASIGFDEAYFDAPYVAPGPRAVWSIAYDEPYFGPGSNPELQRPPLGLFPVSIAGHCYFVDTSFEPYRREAFRHRTIPAQRQAISNTNEAGEGTVNTEGLWRRGQDDWNLGSGQIYLDRKDALDNRFGSSKGVNPWTQWQLTLHQDTLGRYVSTNGVVKAIRVGQYVYLLQGDKLLFTSDWVTFRRVSELPIDGTMLDLCTDGTNVWIACYGNRGIYQTTAGAASATQLVSYGFFDLIAFVNGRLMAASGPSVFNITSPTLAPPPAPLFEHSSPGWKWTSIAGGSSQIYLAGYVTTGAPSFSPVGHGAVYRTTINTDGTALNVPVVALPMATGEYPTCLAGYLNFIFVGTNLGIRMCQTLAAFDPSGNQGDLRAGPLIPNLSQPVSSSVKGITGDGRFVYFTWENFDSESTGLGRLDLSTFIDALAPAYASDLMIPGQGALNWLDWDPITNGPLVSGSVVTVFGVRVTGVWTMDPAKKVTQGYVDSGRITYGIPDDKIAMFLDMKVDEPVHGSFGAQISLDGTDLFDLGTMSDARPRAPFVLGQLRAEEYSLRALLESDGANGSPVLHRWTLKALPAVVSGTMISVVVMFYSEIDAEGVPVPVDPYVEYQFLEGLRQAQEVVEYVEGPLVVDCTVDQLDWLPHKRRDHDTPGGFEGDCVVYLKTLSG